MIARIKPSRLSGTAAAPPSKSMAHRMLLLAALTGGRCKVDNLAFSEDVLAMLDCITALGAVCEKSGNSVTVDGSGFLKATPERLMCRESGNTLRFLIPLCLTLGRRVTLCGSKRLMERPQSVYEDLCRERGFTYESGESVTVRGSLDSGEYTVDGSVSSQFISGLIFALLSRSGDSRINILPPFESRSYVELTLRAISAFGGSARFDGEYAVAVKGQSLTPRNVSVEGDFSNAAFLDAFNCIGSSVKVTGLTDDSAQGDRVYREHFAELCAGCPTVDITDCPDLGPVLMAIAALKNGCTLTGTRRLAIKESDRGEAMRVELEKLGCSVTVEENRITVPKAALHRPETPLSGHNDHRIVMSEAVLCSVLGGSIEGCEAVRKTFPDFFEIAKMLGLDVRIEE